jgi:hypothetical protein
MPRYYLRNRRQDDLIWNTIVLDLPEVTSRDDPELTSALWSEVFDKQVQQSRTFVITDENGKLVFAANAEVE